MTDSYLDMMRESLDKKIRIMKDIEIQNLHQKKLLEQPYDETDSAFDAAVEAKGALIDQLDALNDGFTALFEKVKIEIGDNKDKYREQIAALQQRIRQINDLSATLQREEAENKMLADNYFSDARKKIKEGRRSNNTAMRYYASMNRTENIQPQFFDSKK